jgi:hypothetical protein
MYAWIRELVVVHGGYLVSQGDEVRQTLLQLKDRLDQRGRKWEKLIQLRGRLELLRAVSDPKNKRSVEDVDEALDEDNDNDDEPEIEDVRYLTGENGDSMDDVEEEIVDNDIEEAEMVNGIESDEEGDSEEDEDAEDEEDEEDEEREDGQSKKPNGVPHFSDSDDSALDLDDLIDDEAIEASEDESEEEEEELPPPKKSKRHR